MPNQNFYIPNGQQIVRAFTFDDQVSHALTRDNSGRIVWVNRPDLPVPTEVLVWDIINNILTAQGIDNQPVNFRIPRFNTANRPTPSAAIKGSFIFNLDLGQIQVCDGTTWLSFSSISFPIAVAQGGTGDTTLTANGILIGEGTSPINAVALATGQFIVGNTGADPTALGPLANGQLLIGSTGARPVAATITPKTNSDLNVVGGAGTLQLGIPGGYRVSNLVGNPNAGTPNTKYDYSADLVVLRNTSDGSIHVATNTGVLTNDVTVAGSTANGRDQAGAFGASSWIHFYFIWNGTTLATLSSATAPPTGPTLPAGYTHWAYAGAIRFSGGSILVGTTMVGNKLYYRSGQTALNGGAATIETAISLSTFIPPNALRIGAEIEFVNVTNNVGNTRIRFITGNDFYFVGQVSTTAGTGNADSYCEFPNVGQNLFYINSGAGDSTSVVILNYTVPNGGE